MVVHLVLFVDVVDSLVLVANSFSAEHTSFLLPKYYQIITVSRCLPAICSGPTQKVFPYSYFTYSTIFTCSDLHSLPKFDIFCHMRCSTPRQCTHSIRKSQSVSFTTPHHLSLGHFYSNTFCFYLCLSTTFMTKHVFSFTTIHFS